MRRSTDVLRALGALLALGAVVIGVPALLVVAIGWPLPSALPRLAEISETFGGDRPLETATVWKVLAVVLWIAWAQVAVATISELVACVRGGLPRLFPGLHLAHGLVAPLVAAIVVTWPTGAASRAAAAVPAPIVYERVPSQVSSEASPAPAPSTLATPTVEHTVQRRDTLWDLAERYLGDGFRATELFELNKGRSQPDGRTLTDPGLLRPGWVLHIPAPAEAATDVAPGDEVVVEPGDSLWELAEEHLADGHRYHEVFDVNVGRPQPDGDTLRHASLIRPGWRLSLPTTESVVAVPPEPAAPAPAPTSGAAPSTTTTVAAVPEPVTTTAAAGASALAEVERGPAAQHESERRGFGALGVAGGFLAAGIGAAVALGRRRQRVRRRPGTEVPPLPEASTPVLQSIGAADADLATRIELALRHLGMLLRDRPSVPLPVVVSAHGGHLDLLLDRADTDPPEPWRAEADGRVWRSSLDDLVLVGAEGPAWVPALATLGALENDGVLVNLEAVGAISLHGEPVAATAIARSIAVEIAVTPLADFASVHVVGDAIGSLALPNLHRHESVEAALDAALQYVASIPGGLAGSGCSSASELRCRAPEEAWSPAIVVAAVGECASEDVARLVAVGGEHAGIAAVLIGSAEGAFGVNVAGGVVHMEPLDLRCAAQVLDESTVDDVVELLDAVETDCIDVILDEPLTLFEPTPLAAVDSGADTELHLRLLGSPALEGADVKPQQLAILAFLALHREVSGDALRDAVWAGSRPQRDRFLNTISDLRRVVGGDVLPVQTDGKYRLCNVWCDVAEVERLLADHEGDRSADLRAALELVQGPPLAFDSRHRRHFTWVDTGNHASRWERLIGDAAHELAGMALRDEDTDLARWAAERGLMASPGNETLTRDLLAAYVAGGDRVTAERLSDEYARSMEDLGYPDAPDLLAELTEERRAS